MTSQGLDTHQTPATPAGQPRPKAQYNFTDPESRIQERGGEFLQGYNCQAVVDGHAQIIIAQGVSNLQPDNSHLQPMVEQAIETCGAVPDDVLGDAGYWKPEHEAYGENREIELTISTRRAKHGESRPPAEAGEAAGDPRARMSAKLQTDVGREAYARRKAIVEPVFGQVKEARGFRRFHLRGLRKVIGEWSLVTAAHNLLKLYRNSLVPVGA